MPVTPDAILKAIDADLVAFVEG